MTFGKSNPVVREAQWPDGIEDAISPSTSEETKKGCC